MPHLLACPGRALLHTLRCRCRTLPAGWWTQDSWIPDPLMRIRVRLPVRTQFTCCVLLVWAAGPALRALHRKAAPSRDLGEGLGQG